MNQNDKNKLEKFGMTHNQLQELRSFLVERIVDNMSMKDLVIYVTDDMQRWIDDQTFNDAMVEIEEYFDEYFTDTIQDVIESVNEIEAEAN